MELNEAIEKRRTVRDFQNRMVPVEIIDYALNNAFKAPSYNHLREWDFIIMNTMEAKLKLVDCENLNKVMNIKGLENAFENEELIKREMYVNAIPKQKSMILNAPSVVVVVFKPKTKAAEAKCIYDLNCLSSVWTCIENFLLSLAEHDVYAVTYIPKNIDVLKQKLEIPAALEIAAIIPFGYKSPDAKTLKQKEIDLIQHIHYERWQK